MAAIISIIPILLLFVLMMGLKMSGWKSALITLVVTILLALFVAPSIGIIPAKYTGASIYGITFWSVIEGFLKACFPIILIVICAIYLSGRQYRGRGLRCRRSTGNDTGQ